MPRFGRPKLDDANVGQRIAADEISFDFFPVRQGAKNADRPASDVMIGNDVAFLCDDRAAPDRLRLDFPALGIGSGNNPNPDQRRRHVRDCRIHGGVQVAGHFGASSGSARDERTKRQRQNSQADFRKTRQPGIHNRVLPGMAQEASKSPDSPHPPLIYWRLESTPFSKKPAKLARCSLTEPLPGCFDRS